MKYKKFLWEAIPWTISWTVSKLLWRLLQGSVTYSVFAITQFCLSVIVDILCRIRKICYTHIIVNFTYTMHKYLPSISPPPATMFLIRIIRRFPWAHLFSTNSPGLTERMWFLKDSSSRGSEIILRKRVEIPTKTTEMSSIKSRCRNLKKTNAIPENFNAYMCVH